jgi:hypothetical protein
MSQTDDETRIREDAAMLERAFQTMIGIYTEVASGSSPDATLALLAWATADGVTAAARLAAVADVPPPEDLGDPPEFDMDPLRRGLTNALAGMDSYYEPDDPYDETAPLIGESIVESILLSVSAWQVALHYLAEHGPQAMVWWSQYSALSLWGDRITSAMRMVMLLLSQARLTADVEAVALERARGVVREVSPPPQHLAVARPPRKAAG